MRRPSALSRYSLNPVPGRVWRKPTYWPYGVRCAGGVTLIRAFAWNLRSWPTMPRAETARPKVPMRRPGADCSVVVIAMYLGSGAVPDAFNSLIRAVRRDGFDLGQLAARRPHFASKARRFSPPLTARTRTGNIRRDAGEGVAQEIETKLGDAGVCRESAAAVLLVHCPPWLLRHHSCLPRAPDKMY